MDTKTKPQPVGITELKATMQMLGWGLAIAERESVWTCPLTSKGKAHAHVHFKDQHIEYRTITANAIHRHKQIYLYTEDLEPLLNEVVQLADQENQS